MTCLRCGWPPPDQVADTYLLNPQDGVVLCNVPVVGGQTDDVGVMQAMTQDVLFSF
jgi:hypothetical protein